jgi:endo-1,4-beta-xylanase
MFVSIGVALITPCDAEDFDPLHVRFLAVVQEKLPVKASPVCDGSRLSDFRLLGKEPKADYSFVPVTGQPFSRAIRVNVAARTPNGYDVQILTPPTTQPLKKGEHILAVLNVRCTTAPDGAGVFGARIQGGAPTWGGIGSTDVVVGADWKRIYIHGQAMQDFAAGAYDLALHVGSQAQTLEIGGLALLNLGSKVDVAKLPFTSISYPGQEPDAPWRKAAADRIDKYRKGDLTVRVVDKAGQPVVGAKVHLQMQRHAYGFGTFLECQLMVSQSPDADKLREWTLKLFNRCTTPIYWADWGWANPKSRERYMQCAKWAFDNKLTTRGHCIIYPGWKYLPKEITPLANDPPALRKRLLEQVVEVTEATKPFNFSEYDVTNELRDLKEIHSLLGKDAVAEWFKVAREHASKTSRLAINENTILTRGGVTQAEQDNYAEWIQYLIDQKVGPDVIGMQGHFGEAVTGPETVIRILDRFAKFGKPIQITEFDLITRDEAGQARYLRDFLTAVFSHPATDAFTMWGFWEGKMWQPPGAMIRKDWTLKPNGQAWIDLVLKEWWTDVTLTTGRDGSCSARGFLGDYAITVGEAKEKSTPATLTKDGTTVKIEIDRPM